MEKEILENQALQAHMMFFDPPDRLIQLRNPFPKELPSDFGKVPFEKLLQMEFTQIEPAVKVLDNGDVRFRFFAPEANTVEIAGLNASFPQGRLAMAKSEDGWWCLTVSGIAPGFHYYDCFVDGNRTINPDAQCGYGCGRVINFFDLPVAEDDFWMLKDVPHGDIRMEYYKSSDTGMVERAWVYTPPDYDNETCRYPVLYIQPGEGENEMGWIWQGRINLIADNLIAAGKCRKLLIVIHTGNMIVTADTPVALPGGIIAGLTDGSIPFVNMKYRTLAGKRHRAAICVSGGGKHAWGLWRISAYEYLQMIFQEEAPNAEK